MKKIQAFIILLVGMVLLMTAASTTFAAPKTYELTFNNRTPKTVEMSLIGAENKVVSLPPFEKTRLDLYPGVYQYSFYDCGQLYIDTVNMNKDREIKLVPCSGLNSGATGSTGTGGTSPNLITFVLNNKTYRTLTVGLVGMQNYSVDVAPGKTFLDVYKGTYQVSYYDCGKLNVSTVKITKDDTQFKILNCGQGQGDLNSTTGDTGTTAPPTGFEVEFFVKNETYASFDILFLTDQVYSFHVIPGKNKIYLKPGNYQYSYYACGELWVGDLRIARKDQDIRISSCSSSSGRPDTGENIIFKVKNLVGNKFTLTLDGPQFYTLNVKAGSGNFFEVQKGYYKFQYYACGTLVSGEVFLKDGVTLKTVNCPGQ